MKDSEKKGKKVQTIARCQDHPHSKTNHGKRDGKTQLMAGAVITEKKHEENTECLFKKLGISRNFCLL